jgi:hypothetical protein
MEMSVDFQWMAQHYISEDRNLRSRNPLHFMDGTGMIITMCTGICENDVPVIQTHVIEDKCEINVQIV